MVDKTPNTDRSGIERRNLLKGLGFGAMGLAGASAFAGSAAAKPSPVNVGLTPPGEDLEDDEVSFNSSHVAQLDPSKFKTYDLVAFTNMDNVRNVVGHHFAILTRQSSPKVVTQAFEEGTAEAATREVKANESGVAELRHNFSVEALSSGSYIATLTLIDYTSIDPASIASSGNMRGTVSNLANGDSLTAGNVGTVVAHAFDVV